MNPKAFFCTAAGFLGGVFAAMFGGWSAALAALLICMGIDYATGLVVAGVFHKSTKSAGGGLESRAGWKGLLRKAASLAIVLVAHCLDVLLGTGYVRDAVIIALCVNEILSILENCGLMGVPIPKALVKAIDVLKSKQP